MQHGSMLRALVHDTSMGTFGALMLCHCRRRTGTEWRKPTALTPLALVLNSALTLDCLECCCEGTKLPGKHHVCLRNAQTIHLQKMGSQRYGAEKTLRMVVATLDA